MIPPFLHFHAVVKKIDGVFHRVQTASGFPNKQAAMKHLENGTGDKVVSFHETYGGAELAATQANQDIAPVAGAETESIAGVALNAPEQGINPSLSKSIPGSGTVVAAGEAPTSIAIDAVSAPVVA